MTTPLSSKIALLPCVLLFSLRALGFDATVSEPSTGITLTVTPAGEYAVEASDPAFRFGGNLNTSVTDLVTGVGKDNIGNYQEIAFQYSDSGARSARIRTYVERPVVLFSVRYLEAGPNATRFPVLTTYPRNLSHLTFEGLFGAYRYDTLASDGPWVFFEANANTFILSAASQFGTATTARRGVEQRIEIGVNPDIATLPKDFQFDTILVVEKGINRAFDIWGRALTDLNGKVRPSNDADVTLTRLGYWTDNGAAYYYEWERELGYSPTLLRVKEEFEKKGVPLGYLQLDSWFYQKGARATWDEMHGGIYRYEADTWIFPRTLKSFQELLGIPLVAHGRWIDVSSPYRSQYRMSNNVSTDPLYWDAIANYLRESGVVTYEQDWLGAGAQPSLNMNDRREYLSQMSRAGREKNLTIQYCMPLPRHYMQSSRYGNVTTIRTSDDRFSRGRWDQFLYGSRFASALGVWPWSDVFMSYEPDNLLLSTLSAGPVGVGDKLGDVNASNLLRAVRGDGVIVKPDAPIVPVDDLYFGDARADWRPMVASTYTAFEQSKALYVFAYQRGADTNVSFAPESLGLPGRVYLYNYFTGTGTALDAAATYRDTLTDRGYYIAAPIGPSGIAFLGDAGHFVTLGKKRITSVKDDGAVEAAVAFAPGESTRTLFGYSPSMPVVTALQGAAEPPVYDEDSHIFRVVVTPDAGGSAVVQIR